MSLEQVDTPTLIAELKGRFDAFVLLGCTDDPNLPATRHRTAVFATSHGSYMTCLGMLVSGPDMLEALHSVDADDADDADQS